MKTLSMSRILLALLVFSAFVCEHAPFAIAQSEQHPLAPPDLSSPRATLMSFNAGMNAVYHR